MRVSFTAWYRNNWQRCGIFSVQCVSVCERLLAWTERWVTQEAGATEAGHLYPTWHYTGNNSLQRRYIHFEIKSWSESENDYTIRFGILNLPKQNHNFTPCLKLVSKFVSQYKRTLILRVTWQKHAENNIYRIASNRRTERNIRESSQIDLPSSPNINQLDKLIVAHLFNIFPPGTLRFITDNTKAHHWSLSRTKLIQSTPYHTVLDPF